MGLVGGTPRELEFRALFAAVDDLRERFENRGVGPGSNLLGNHSPFTKGLARIMTRD
jgi:hypothetical protein